MGGGGEHPNSKTLDCLNNEFSRVILGQQVDAYTLSGENIFSTWNVLMSKIKLFWHTHSSKHDWKWTETSHSITGDCCCGYGISEFMFHTSYKIRHREWNKSSYDVFVIILCDQKQNSSIIEREKNGAGCHKRFRYRAINVESQLFNGRKLPTEKPRTRREKNARTNDCWYFICRHSERWLNGFVKVIASSR